MKTIIIPTFDEFNNYQFVKNVEVKIKNDPSLKDLHKVEKHLPGIPQGGVRYPYLQDLLTTGKKEVRSFYDARQNTRKFKNYFVTVKN